MKKARILTGAMIVSAATLLMTGCNTEEQKQHREERREERKEHREERREERKERHAEQEAEKMDHGLEQDQAPTPSGQY